MILTSDAHPVFDEGVLRSDVPAAQRKLGELMALMKGTFRIEQKDDQLGYIFQSVWDRFVKVSMPDDHPEQKGN